MYVERAFAHLYDTAECGARICAATATFSNGFERETPRGPRRRQFDQTQFKSPSEFSLNASGCLSDAFWWPSSPLPTVLRTHSLGALA